MRNKMVRIIVYFIITILFIGSFFSSSIADNIDKSLLKNSNNFSHVLSEEEIYRSNYMDIPIRFRYRTEDGQIHIVTKSRSEIMAEQIKYYEKEDLLNIPTSYGNGNHPPIYIEGNDDFTFENGVTGGSGTLEDPYIIENWIIVDGSAENGIFVTNTNAYFIIRNCTLIGFSGDDYSGIRFSNVENGVIDDSDCFDNYYGILIQVSSHIIINNSIFHNNYGWYATGILCIDSSYITIMSCECFDMHGPTEGVPTGIVLDESSHCLIEYTSCYKNSHLGISIEAIKRNPCEYDTIKNCKIYNNQWGGYIFHV